MTTYTDASGNILLRSWVVLTHGHKSGQLVILDRQEYTVLRTSKDSDGEEVVTLEPVLKPLRPISAKQIREVL